VCGENVGFRLFVRALRREEVIENLRMLSQEMCDGHVGTLRTVFADVSLFRGIEAGTDLVEPLRGTPAGAVLESAIRHAQERYDIWYAKICFSSPEAAQERAEARKKRIAEDQVIRAKRRVELDKKLLRFRKALDQLDLDRLLSDLQGLEDPFVFRAVGGIAYPVLREYLRHGKLNEAELVLLKKFASNHRGYWAKLLKMSPGANFQ